MGIDACPLLEVGFWQETVSMACWVKVLITIEKIVISAPKFAKFLLPFQHVIMVENDMKTSLNQRYIQTRKRP